MKQTKKEILKRLDDYKEVIDIKLKDKRNQENSDVGKWGVYHMLYKGWRNFCEGKDMLSNLNIDDEEQLLAIKNLAKVITGAADKIMKTRYKEAIVNISNNTDLEASFFFITNIYFSMTVLNAVLELQKMFFDDDISLQEKQKVAKEMLNKNFGNNLLDDLMFPAFGYFLEHVTGEKSKDPITRELYDFIMNNALGSKSCSHEGLRKLFEVVLTL